MVAEIFPSFLFFFLLAFLLSMMMDDDEQGVGPDFVGDVHEGLEDPQLPYYSSLPQHPGR